jgi:predicted SAM-dependent methyltransferase
MPLRTISLQRPLTSYAKVQAAIGCLIRNRRFQLRRERVRAATYLDVGCGPNTHADFVNLDFLWHPKVDVCWDIRRGLPFSNGSMQGVFSEHCLEHFSLPSAMNLLREIRRVLAPDGLARIVVPDGELYLRTYARQLDGDASPRFPYPESEAAHGLWTPMLSVNRIFYQDRESLFGHRTIFDFQLLQALLLQCGFGRATRREFLHGADPRLLVDTPSRQVESLYVEASPAP